MKIQVIWSAQWIPRLGTDIAYANWRINKKEEGEVDIVGIDTARQKPWWAVEVKWSDRYAQHPEELTSLLSFLAQNDMRYALVTSKTETIRHQMQACVLQFIPVACYAYTVGKNTINRTKQRYGL